MLKSLLTFLVLGLAVNFCFAQPTSAYCETEVLHFAGDLPSAINLTIENIDPNTIKVEIESVTADAVDFLLVVNGSGATISPEDFSVPGKISRTLTWAAPPADVMLNVLWSKDNFPGNWQLSTADITVPFAAICPSGPPISAYCETEVTHFAGDLPSTINLTIANVDPNTMIVEIESVTADAVDFLLVVNGSGATISDEDTSVPGKISRTLTWAAPPADVVLNVLWSKENFPGNWQLSTTDITVPFAAVCNITPPPPVSAYCETEVLHFGGDLPSAINLTIENIDDFTMKVEIESADADPVDFLLVVNGSGAAISDEDTSVPGKISRTLTWAVAPTDVDLNVLWSKDNFPGNWQLSANDITVPFAAVCPAGPPTSIYCETEVTHFAGDPPSAINLTIANIDANTMYVEIESADSDPVDFLQIDGAAGADISAVNASVPGKLSRTLTWAVAPSDVTLNVLWSKESFPGNWQLGAGNITVPFAATCPLSPPPPPPNPIFCNAYVQHLGIPTEVATAIFLTITNVDANTMKVEIESADADPVDFLLVTNGSGAVISAEDTSVPGKISRTLTWAAPPAEVTLNVLWSKVSFPGNWQVSPSDFQVDFATVCADAIPTMGEWAMFLFALIMLTIGVVFVMGMQAETSMATSQGAVPVKIRRFPFDKANYLKALQHAFGLALVGFAFIYLVWGEIVPADFVGMALTIPVVAYLLHLFGKVQR
ncbi:MAG: hypothetical protein AAFZ15_28150 [Bacteroidota bacterium]